MAQAVGRSPLALQSLITQGRDLPSVLPCPVPDDSLLGRYRNAGAYTDCYTTDLLEVVSHQAFVTAFYTTRVFKLERLILKLVVSKPSTDAQAAQLAEGSLDTFSAWSVEDRDESQLLLSDFHGRTKSWLMTAPFESTQGVGTRFYFGSAVVPLRNPDSGMAGLGLMFRPLLGFHKVYSKVLLRAARSRLESGIA